MIERIFSLASITSLTGLVLFATQACSSSVETVGGPDDDAGGVRTNDGGGGGGGEGGTPDGGEENVDEGVPGSLNPMKIECLGTGTAIDATQYGYRPPNVVKGACTQQNLDDIVKFQKDNPTKTYDDLHVDLKAKSAACDACVFGDPLEGKTWPPIFLYQEKFAGINTSGCVEIVAAKGIRCGIAHRRWDQCLEEACGDCAPGTKSACYDDATGGRCLAAAQQIATDCGQAADNAIATCTASLDAVIKPYCL